MAFNKNELILDRVRSLTAHDLGTGEMMFRLTSLEEPSLNVTAEGEEVTDAVGARITTMYRSKKAEFTAQNSLISLDLAAAQFGAKKEVGDTSATILDHTYEILDFTSKSTIDLAHEPKNPAAIKFAYEIVDGGIGRTFRAGSVASETEFAVSTKTITPPTNFKGKLYVEYDFDNENALRIKNTVSQFPSAYKVVLYVYFRDVCNENLIYSGKILMPNAKIDPESIELSLTSAGKHPITMQMQKDYCSGDDNAELFTIIVSDEG